ncbi:MAG: excinuclease ABC subunit UvrC [Mucinivorans sp.]
MKEKVALLPTSAGVYQFLDNTGTVIYVGKAINLRSRVSSYFNSDRDHSPKVRALVRHIVDLRHVVVDSERDALLLENNLIKELQPRYNILLKDAKSYPWIMITAEPFPRVISTRRLERGKGEYFGPYSSVGMQRVVLELIRELFPLRTCKLNLSPAAIGRGKYSVCLKYHMGHCRGGCVGKENEADYSKYIDGVRDILRGSLGVARQFLERAMGDAAAALRFEEAESYKKKLHSLDEYSHRSVIVSPTLGTLDVVNMEMDDNRAYCNHLKVVNGSIIGSYTFEMVAHLDETPAEILAFAMMHLTLSAPQIVVPMMPSEFTDRCFVPQRGDKIRLLELSAKNCMFFRLEKLKNLERKDPALNVDRVMENMRRELMMDIQPRHIECFDNSNLQGTFPVASCVVFRDGKPAKRDYRHFNIKTVVGADDFASMKEVVGRRYRRMLDEGTTLPQLIVVDGGKGQLSSAYDTLCELGLQDKIKIVGLAKRLEEVFFVGDSTPHYLDRKGESLRILMHLRDEAHRFGITFHRNKRSKQIPSK